MRANPAPRAPSAAASVPLTARSLAAEGELPAHRSALEGVGRDLPAGHEDADGDRQVEPRARLAERGGREVRGEALERKVEAGVQQGGAYPLARLSHRRVGQADERERGQPRPDVDLDGDLPALDALEREGGDAGEHWPKLWGADARLGAIGTGPATIRRARRLRIVTGVTHMSRDLGLACSGMNIGHPDTRIALGGLGERLAREHLERAGYEMVERNFRCGAGELDVVAADARALVFCEVKTRVAGGGRGPGGPTRGHRDGEAPPAAPARPGVAHRSRREPPAQAGDPLRRGRRDGHPAPGVWWRWTTWRTRSRGRAEAACRRSIGTTSGAAAKRRAGRSPPGAPGSNSRRWWRSPTAGGARRLGACSGRG